MFLLYELPEKGDLAHCHFVFFYDRIFRFELGRDTHAERASAGNIPSGSAPKWA
jgi:hypothetical protein